MRSKLLVSTAASALLAGLLFATAQEMPRSSNADRPTQDRAAPGQQRGTAPEQQRNNESANQHSVPSAQRAAPGGAERSGSDASQRSAEEPSSRNHGKAKRAEPKTERNGTNTRQSARPDDRDQRTRDRVGTDRNDGQRKKNAQQKRQQTDSGDRTAGSQRQERDRRRDRQADQEERSDNDRTVSNRGRLELSVDQRTRIRQTVLSRSNVPRVDRVNFNISVGVNVPTHVRLATVPTVIVDIYPRFRGYRYFVVEEEIIIVDGRRHIVAVIPVETAGGGGSGAVTFVDLSPEEIRQVQAVLVERGYSIEIDGVLGPRTQRALRLFQQRNGIQVTGRIDRRTVTQLGVSFRTGETSRTVGQGGRDRHDQGQQHGRHGGPDQATHQSGGGRDIHSNDRQDDAGPRQWREPSTVGQGASRRDEDAGDARAQANQPPTAASRNGMSGKQSRGAQGSGDPDRR